MIPDCNGKGNTVSRDIWQTPQRLFDLLNEQYNFRFDCCSNNQNRKCKNWSDDFEKVDKTLIEDGVVYMNPPFSIANRMFKHFFKVVKRGVAIYGCDNLETKIWQKIIFKEADWVFIPDNRIIYEGILGKSPRFPSALIGKGVEPPNDIDGVVLKVIGV